MMGVFKVLYWLNQAWGINTVYVFKDVIGVANVAWNT